MDNLRALTQFHFFFKFEYFFSLFFRKRIPSYKNVILGGGIIKTLSLWARPPTPSFTTAPPGAVVHLDRLVATATRNER